MEKSSMERDLDDWEFLSDDGFLDLGGHHETAKSALFARGTAGGVGPKGLVDVNYFVCPPNPPHLLIGAADGLIPASGFRPQATPGRSEPAAEKNPDVGFIREIKEIAVAPPVLLANQEVISQVFFRKLGESEFADMKLDSPPKSPTARSVKLPLVEVAGPVEYEEKGVGEGDLGKGEEQGHGGNANMAPRVEEEGKECSGRSGAKGKGCWEGFGFSIWRWRITGVGALCSLGVAAATICIFIMSGRQRQKHQQQNQKLQFHVYHDEKSIKQVVQQATRINQAISVVRGVPMTRAHISFGGYYDGL